VDLFFRIKTYKVKSKKGLVRGLILIGFK